MSQFTYRHTMALVGQRLAKHFSKLDTSAGAGRPDGLVGKAELEAATKDKSLPLDVRLAAKAALDNFDWFETPEGGKPDGLAGLSDFEAKKNLHFTDAPPPSAAARAVAAELLRESFGRIDGALENDRPWDRGQDGLLDRGELQSFLSGSSAEHARMAGAAGQELWEILDLGAGIGGRDHQVGLRDLETMVEKGKQELGD